MESKTVLVTGATGFIGRHFCQSAQSKGWHVIGVTRYPDHAKHHFPEVRFVKKLADLPVDEKIDYVVNLAGEPLVAGRWNNARKKAFLDSRVGITNQLFEHFRQSPEPPEVLVSGSAVGYYGPHNDKILDEAAKHHDSYSHTLCSAWEHSAAQFLQLGTRVCYLRTGIVLGAGEGALARMTPPFKMGLGGRIGSGKQWMPWIHINDEIALIFHCLKRRDIKGSVNACSPNPVTNKVFSQSLGSVLSRPVIFPMPSLVAKMLFGEMAEELLLSGQRVYPRKALESGFKFTYPELDTALANIFEK
jgi:uncharacterized protein (TIGR01777 family)